MVVPVEFAFSSIDMDMCSLIDRERWWLVAFRTERVGS